MAHSRTPVDGYHKALELLGARPHFRAELRAKLAARGYLEPEVEAVLGRLDAEGLLDDRANARSFVRSLLERRPLGRRRLAAELARRGVDEEVAAEALGALDLDDSSDSGDSSHHGDNGDNGDGARARLAAASWTRRRQFSAAALGRHLERLGFGQRVILEVLEERAAIAERTSSEPAPEDSLEPLPRSEPGESGAVASVTGPAVGFSRSRGRDGRYEDDR